MMPGFIMDMFKIHAKYEFSVNGIKMQKKLLGG